MAVIKRVIIIVLIFSMSIVLLVVGQGNKMYKEALENKPLEEKVAEIREQVRKK